MDGQGAALDERLFTWLVVTCVGALVGVDAIVSLEIRFAVEALWREWSWSASHAFGQLTEGGRSIPLRILHAICIGRVALAGQGWQPCPWRRSSC